MGGKRWRGMRHFSQFICQIPIRPEALVLSLLPFFCKYNHTIMGLSQPYQGSPDAALGSGPADRAGIKESSSHHERKYRSVKSFGQTDIRNFIKSVIVLQPCCSCALQQPSSSTTLRAPIFYNSNHTSINIKSRYSKKERWRSGRMHVAV